MYKIHYLNPISPKGMELWTSNYEATDCIAAADAAVVRSAGMHDISFDDGLLAIARAGAGVNNIPLDRCAENGTVVFNTPGANANGVVELALCGMLLGGRDIIGGINWVTALKGGQDVTKLVEKGKSKFVGCEIRGKKLGVIGLGAIGGPLANAAKNLGMQVYGCDPFISIDAAWHLDSHIIRVKTREEIYEKCDYISLHVPLMEDTRNMLDEQALSSMKDGVVILNFARDLLVDDVALEAALLSGKVKKYVTDFPNDRTAGMDGVIAIPHLGASTNEAEDNCAQMAVRQIMNFLENGNIVNSVNFPNCDMGMCTKASRITILHRNVPNMLSRFTSAIAGAGINISDLINRSRGEYAYTMLDLDAVPSTELVSELKQIDSVIRVRLIR